MLPGLLGKKTRHLLFPERCVACGKCDNEIDGVLCWPCRNLIESLPKNLCGVCGRPLPFDYEIDTGEFYECGDCRKKPPPFKRLKFALAYENPIRELMLDFKFNSARRLAKPLAEFGRPTLVPWFAEWPSAIVVPVPLSPYRLFSRGYNPSFLLARFFCNWSGLELADGALRKVRATRSQTGLSIKARAKNVKGAFTVFNHKAIEGKKVILFDDIHTTGATVRECCKTLKKAKPEAIRVATLCRTEEGR